MSLISQLDADLKSAMISRDSELTALLRLLKAALKNEMIALKKQDLADDEALKVLKREAKKREDSSTLFQSGGRPDLAAKEQAELVLIKKYLPNELSEDQVRELVGSVIGELGATTPSQFGLVMKAAMAKAGGLADGSVVSKIVKELLK